MSDLTKSHHGGGGLSVVPIPSQLPLLAPAAGGVLTHINGKSQLTDHHHRLIGDGCQYHITKIGSSPFHCYRQIVIDENGSLVDESAPQSFSAHSSSPSSSISSTSSTSLTTSLSQEEFSSRAKPITRHQCVGSWLHRVVGHVIEDMNQYGLCVIDGFLGLDRGDCVLKEVKTLYGRGFFKGGQLVGDKLRAATPDLRGDKILWLTGKETSKSCSDSPALPNIHFLLQCLDHVVSESNAQRDKNGIFAQHDIRTRTKAMIACYPGSGTRYVRHVDNPSSDGRCITAIYYLNRDWDVTQDGGLLRLFPVGFQSQVADIEPRFDRVIFFWSDRRNPHEVQPAYSTRFAITAWYFDSNEREQALERIRQSGRPLPAPDETFIPFQI